MRNNITIGKGDILLVPMSNMCNEFHHLRKEQLEHSCHVSMTTMLKELWTTEVQAEAKGQELWKKEMIEETD